jgi:hypothetical protein
MNLADARTDCPVRYRRDELPDSRNGDQTRTDRGADGDECEPGDDVVPDGAANRSPNHQGSAPDTVIDQHRGTDPRGPKQTGDNAGKEGVLQSGLLEEIRGVAVDVGASVQRLSCIRENRNENATKVAPLEYGAPFRLGLGLDQTLRVLDLLHQHVELVVEIIIVHTPDQPTVSFLGVFHSAPSDEPS